MQGLGIRVQNYRVSVLGFRVHLEVHQYPPAQVRDHQGALAGVLCRGLCDDHTREDEEHRVSHEGEHLPKVVQRVLGFAGEEPAPERANSHPEHLELRVEG